MAPFEDDPSVVKAYPIHISHSYKYIHYAIVLSNIIANLVLGIWEIKHTDHKPIEII